MIGTILEANPFLGRIITGRIESGSVKPNQAVKVLHHDGTLIENGRISKILAFRGLERQPIEEAQAGDIVAIAGLSKGTVADTFCDPSVTEPLHAQPIDPPTVTMSFLVNDSPARRHRRRQGDQPRHPRPPAARSRRQCRAEDRGIADKDSFYVSGRGELQLAVLIETMRREGFELAVSRPRVVMQKDEQRRDAGAGRGSRHRRRRGACRHRRAEDVGAQGRDGRAAPVRRQPPAPRLPRADARPDRLPVGTADRHARHRRDEPAVPRLPALQGRHCPAAPTAC